MDCMKTGDVIARARKSKGLTQRALAEKLNISDKAVSKWERGLGFPDVSLLSELAALLGLNVESILSGNESVKSLDSGNLKRMKFYVCPVCGNILWGMSEAAVYCCGRKLPALTPIKSAPAERLAVLPVENEIFITSTHEMLKSHYIAFVGILTSDRFNMVKLYPEWNAQARFAITGRGMLIWYCTRHGLFYQDI